MPVMIFVSGPGNTGKTSAILGAMKALGIEVKNSGDITMAAQCYVKSGNFRSSSVGFATGGDNAAVVVSNCQFFQRLRSLPDYLVMACRSGGGSWSALNAFAQSLGVTPIWIVTARQTGGVPAYWQATTQQIISHIP
ncbi:hypothetical protein [Bosea sp. LjRoot237]|uniref:hypothetical protein n=1 Tax=Bosea sp. LjRoot237 TaxID=3342292 RepID=UPI003ECE0A7F